MQYQTSNGDYKVVNTVESCVVESTCVTVSSLSANELKSKSKFLIYSNPSSHLMKIKSQDQGDFQIINVLGKVVKTFSVESNVETSVVIDELSEGLYFVKSTITNSLQKIIIHRK